MRFLGSMAGVNRRARLKNKPVRKKRLE